MTYVYPSKPYDTPMEHMVDHIPSLPFSSPAGYDRRKPSSCPALPPSGYQRGSEWWMIIVMPARRQARLM